MPFARAAQMLQRLLGVQVSEATTRRLTEQAGALLEARQTMHSQNEVSKEPTTAVCAKQVISVDGAYVPLTRGEWTEVRTVAVGEIKEETTGTGQREAHATQLSYFLRMTDATTFTELAEVEMRRSAVS